MRNKYNNPAVKAMRRWLEDNMSKFYAPYYSSGAKALRLQRARRVAYLKPYSAKAKARVVAAINRKVKARPSAGFPFKAVTYSEDGEPSYVE